MIDKDSVEKALLLGIVKTKNWNVLILNNITIDFFTYANQGLYNYIKDYADKGEYPDLRVIAYQFQIDEQSMMEYLQIGDLDGLCDTLRRDYTRNKLEVNLANLNEYSQEINTDPGKYIDRVGDVYNELRLLSHSTKSVGLLDGIDETLTIDPNNVISTGFKELDEKLVGWRRGEELVVFMARTGQGKSWFGLKFALSAALQGEKVGIYSGEMSKQQLQERILCCAKQTYTSTKEEALEFLKTNNVNIRLLTQKELRRRCNVNDLEEMIIRDNLTMLVIDQLSLMEDINQKSGIPLRQSYGNITNDLMSLSQKYNLPIILLVQSNRQGSQEQNGPNLENIAESDAVAQNATRVISMKNENNILTMRIVKNRYGSADLIQRYDVDYGINKYKPIQDYNVITTVANKNSKVRQMFSGGKTF